MSRKHTYTYKNAFASHCKEISIYVFLEKELRGLSPNFQIHVSVIDLRSVHFFPATEYPIGRPITGIYKSLTET
jgi:hypothetical protein